MRRNGAQTSTPGAHVASDSAILKKVSLLKDRQATLQKFLDKKQDLRDQMKDINRLIDQNLGIIRQMINTIDQEELPLD